MKITSVLSAATVLILGVGTAYAQTSPQVTLSNQNPAAGEKVKVTFNGAGPRFVIKDKPEASVIFFNNKDNEAVDISLKKEGKLWKGDFTVPATAKVMLVKVGEGEEVDDNEGKGYIYLVNKGKQPVEGAYAAKAYILQSNLGSYVAKINPDQKTAAELYAKEFALHPALEKELQANYYGFLISAKDAQLKALGNKKLAELLKSTGEDELFTANTLLLRSGKKAAADSLGEVIKIKFPKGKFAANEAALAIRAEKDLNKKDSLFKVYAAANPETSPVKDILLQQLASAYLQKGDMENFNRYEAQISKKTDLAGAYNNAAFEMAKKGEKLDEAAALSKKSLDLAMELVNNSKSAYYMSAAKMKENNLSTYYGYADTYAYILYKQGKFAEALKQQTEVYENTSYQDAELNEHYALILAANGQQKKAMEVIEKSIIAGKNSDVLKEELKKDYIKVKGSETGFTEYVASLQNTSKSKAKEELAKKVIKMPAPVFTLKDLDGKQVSLTDLKGKVVVVDFWATWCGPCKASFPGMQIAVNKYKDDPNVKFVFIDTWESGENYLPGVKKFIADNKYTFEVLVDEKGEDGRQSKVVSSYKVDGIPTKFIIDKEGNIRFKFVGYSGSTDAVVEEVVNMIEMTSDAEAMKATR